MIHKLKTLSKEAYRAAERCNAPICIVNLWLHSQYAINGGVNCSDGQVWYPDEDICECYRKAAVKKLLNLESGTAPKWIRRQHNIKKHWKKKGEIPNLYFTFEMLNANRMVKGSTKGLSPDVDESIQLKRYFKCEAENGGTNCENNEKDSRCK